MVFYDRMYGALRTLLGQVGSESTKKATSCGADISKMCASILKLTTSSLSRIRETERGSVVIFIEEFIIFKCLNHVMLYFSGAIYQTQKIPDFALIPQSLKATATPGRG